ncbi:unnamed protein product [Periconia digitata]|uniref:Endo-1,4-beta-xylanase n=1 Tax=Periconia digitata TaxID=1303443 RepID=A0A9W4XG31_9PLEO|nr:unnamed protein product [Periconia digitata]
MISLKQILVTAGALFSVAQSQQFIIQNWGNGQDTTNYTYKSLEAGRFTVDWVLGPGGNFVVGKGYRGSPDLVVNYTAKYNPQGNSYFGLYGFTSNPFVEFYVVEAFAEHNPSDNAGHSFYGYHNSDGAQYELWSKYNGNLRQYFAVRRTSRRGGTITFRNHYNAWKAAGLPAGTVGNTFIVVEGQQGRGNADITVGVRPTGTIAETPTPTTRSVVCETPTQTIGTVCRPRNAKRTEAYMV